MDWIAHREKKRSVIVNGLRETFIHHDEYELAVKLLRLIRRYIFYSSAHKMKTSGMMNTQTNWQMGVGRAPTCLTEHVYGLSNAPEYVKKIKNTAEFDRQKLQRCYIIAISVCQINVASMDGRCIMRNITIKL